MGLTIKRKEDKRIVHACTHNVADIPNGVTVCAADLVPGTVLKEGTVIGKGSDGLYHAIKTAAATEAVAAEGKVIKVAKGSHFKEGDFVMAKVGSTAAKITAIDKSEKTYDKITVNAAIGAVEAGQAIQQAKADGASGEFSVTPKAMTGDHYDVEALTNHLVAAVTIGQFKESVIPPVTTDLLGALKGIVLI